MSKKLQSIVPIFLLVINTLLFLFLMLQLFPYHLGIIGLFSIQVFLSIDFLVCLKLQFQAQVEGNTKFYVFLISLIELSLISVDSYRDTLNDYNFIYFLIIICIFVLFYLSFKQMKTRRLPYDLLMIFVFLPLLFKIILVLFYIYIGHVVGIY